MDPDANALRVASTLGALERSALVDLTTDAERQTRPSRRARFSSVGIDAPRLEKIGLVEFVRENRNGATVWRATQTGLRVADAIIAQRKSTEGTHGS